MDGVAVPYDQVMSVRMVESALGLIVEQASHGLDDTPLQHLRMYSRAEFNLWREALSPKITNPHLTPMACEPKSKSSAVHAAQKWLSSAEGAAAGTS